jgi:nodulation protein E
MDARIPHDSVDYINAHGTGTMLNDTTETQAIRAVFGAHADRLAVSSCKAVLGHGLGAAGAFEAAATALAIKRRVLPPTANFEEPDSDCDLDFIPNIARDQRIRCAVSNSFAFGGLNAVLALGEL